MTVRRACDTCYSLKTRCVRSDARTSCERCLRMRIACSVASGKQVPWIEAIASSSGRMSQSNLERPQSLPSTNPNPGQTDMQATLEGRLDTIDRKEGADRAGRKRKRSRGGSEVRETSTQSQTGCRGIWSNNSPAPKVQDSPSPCSLPALRPIEQTDVALKMDCIGAGLLEESHGRELFDLFMQKCLFAVSILDPEVDTWDSLRARSALAVSAIVYLGLKCQEAGRTHSALHMRLRSHAEKLAHGTLFTPVSGIEIVQALVLLGQWGDTSWRPGGHALRIAMEMGLWRCLQRLHDSGIDRVRSATELEAEQSLVTGTRVWLGIFNTEHQMSFNSGQPSLLSAAMIKHCRSFLKHPLAIPTDVRLVSFCELQIIRSPLHDPLDIENPVWARSDLDEKIGNANQEINRWLGHWDSFYGTYRQLPSMSADGSASLGYAEGHLLRESLISISNGTKFFINAVVIKAIRDREEVRNLSPIRYTFLLNTVTAAQQILDRPLRGGKYKEYFRFANASTYMNVAHVAWHLIHLASLAPHLIDTRQLSDDVEACASLLDNVPGYRFGSFLRKILRKARKQNVLPDSAKPPSTEALKPNLHEAQISVEPTQLPSGRPSALPPFSLQAEVLSIDDSVPVGDPQMNTDPWLDLEFLQNLFASPQQHQSARADQGLHWMTEDRMTMVEPPRLDSWSGPREGANDSLVFPHFINDPAQGSDLHRAPSVNAHCANPSPVDVPIIDTAGSGSWWF